MQANRCLSRSSSKKFVISADEIGFDGQRQSFVFNMKLRVLRNVDGRSLGGIRGAPIDRELPSCQLLKCKL